MATFDFDNIPIYYESYGRGEPLLILNGIFMSCASWKGFIPAFSQHNRLLLVDLVDMGRSGKVDHEYTQELQERVVIGLLDHLGLDRVSLCGLSYGGEIAIRLAARYPDRVGKLILSNTCAYTNAWLRDIGRSWQYAMDSHDGHQFFATCIPTIYSPGFYEKQEQWAHHREEMFVQLFTPDVYDAFARLTRSAESLDERANLAKIEAETLVISAQWDFITPLPNQLELVSGIAGASHVIIQDAGHAAMYEKPAEFASLVVGFVNSDTAGIQID